MAFIELYMQTTGSDMNAGSTTDDAAAVTETNGDWGNAAANRFTAASGTPFSAVSVGEWASIYADGTTSGAVYVAQVTAVNGSGASIDLSTTAIYGTAPATGASGKSCKVGGAWASLAIFTSLFSSVTLSASTRINVKAGTYANTTTGRQVQSSGTAAKPGWIRGYNTTPGDIDSDRTLTMPLVTFTSGEFGIYGSYWLISGISVSSTRSFKAFSIETSQSRAWRCKFENTNAEADSYAASHANGTAQYQECFFKATSTATYVFAVTGNACEFTDCVFTGGGIGLNITGGGFSSNDHPKVVRCVFRSCGADGIKIVTSLFTLIIDGCTFRSNGGDGIDVAVALSAMGSIKNCIFDQNGGYGINYSVGSNTNLVFRSNNSFYSNTSGKENGFGDSPSLEEQVESASPLTSATNMTIVDTSLAKGNGTAAYESGVYESSMDIGAVQLEAAAAGGLLVTSGMTGGMRG